MLCTPAEHKTHKHQICYGNVLQKRPFNPTHFPQTEVLSCPTAATCATFVWKASLEQERCLQGQGFHGMLCKHKDANAIDLKMPIVEGWSNISKGMLMLREQKWHWNPIWICPYCKCRFYVQIFNQCEFDAMLLPHFTQNFTYALL